MKGGSVQRPSLKIIILGLSITSSWGNGHATTYRGLVRELLRRGHQVTFLERDEPWYAANRDLPAPQEYARLYTSLEDLKKRFEREVREADFVMIGSYVPEGVEVAEWVIRTSTGLTGFYDIDTPVTLSRLESSEALYLTKELIPRFDLYLSFTGGPILEKLAQRYGAKVPIPFYCSFDPQRYAPKPCEQVWDLGYMGTYSQDRQPALEELFLKPAVSWRAGRFIAAGPLYPEGTVWPQNVLRISHLNPAEHRDFYSAQRFTLNITRSEMVRAGYSPSVRLFEAAGCAAPIISDYWEGIETILEPGREILISR
ncbi:MAG: glycosyltransferase, partial [Betaproteobacteria bacterium HGW-Betaproteobacteria-18]